MKRSREFFLWTFFLAVCFWAGYLKGYLPLTFKQNLFIKGPVRIINAAPFNLPQEFIKALEEDLGQKIEIQRVQSWNDLQAKLVTKTGSHLVLAPVFWAEDLDREYLLMRLNPIQRKIENRISADFISRQGKNLTVLPLYWTVTEFRVHNESPLGPSVDAALTQKSAMELHLYPDQDLMASHLQVWEKSLPVGSLNIRDIYSFQFNKVPLELPKNSVWEVPQLVQIPNSRVLTAAHSRSLIVYGMMIPRNSLNKKLSYRLIEKMMEPSLEEQALAKLPLGSTLQVETADFKITKEQRPSELRDLNLHELIVLEKRQPDLFQKYWQKYNFISRD